MEGELTVCTVMKITGRVKRNSTSTRCRKYVPKRELSIKEIEKLLGIDKIEPVHVTSSITKQIGQDDFKEMYEYELRKFFNSL